MALNKKTLEDIEVTGRRALVRVDFNVPQDDEGAITDDRRIRAALPTIEYLLRQNARVILVSHLGRPKGVEDRWRLNPVAERLSGLLDRPVRKIDTCVGAEAEAAAESLEPGQVLLLENVRFHPEETKNDPEFSGRLAALAEVFVNDAFGAAHRAHASTEGVTHFLPAVAGYLLARELEVLGRAVENPARPFVAILGGAKVSDKIGVIRHLLPRVDVLLIGGGMANPFIRAEGYDIGRSRYDEADLEPATEMLALARAEGQRLEIPSDVVTADDLRNPTRVETVSITEIPPDLMALDIGPETVARYRSILSDARTVIWNGPMGVFETPRFADGTRAIAESLAEQAARGANVIIGGGDSAAAVEQMGLADRMTHISTGGGASLEFLEGRELPGVSALLER
jgi:phosphoglycerate kinase